MRTKYVVLVLAIAIAALFLPSAGANAQPNVPILEVDTLTYLGKTGAGEAGGALFLPDGNIIALWKDSPLIIDSKSGEILRTLDKSPIEGVVDPQMTTDGTKLVTRVMGPFLTVWDIPSGKILKQTNEKISRFSISNDGSKLYVTEKINGPEQGIISILDINTLERIDRFCKNDFESAGHIAISPDGQTLAVSVYRKANNDWDKKTNQVILIDLKDKSKYTVVEELEPSVKSMEFSPDGKQIAFAYVGVYPDIYIYIYNFETKKKNYLKLSDFQNILGSKLYIYIYISGYTPT
jgi:WD40 repeat protein